MEAGPPLSSFTAIECPPDDNGSAAPPPTNPIRYLLSGGFGGVCNVLTAHPLDTVKLRLQTMAPPTPGQPPMYTGTWDCIQKTIRHEGVRGLYKGMGAPLVSTVPNFAMSFFGYGIGQRLLQECGAQDRLSLGQIYAAGALSGLFTTSVMVPGDRIKCLLQVQRGKGEKYSGPVDAARQLYREGGIRNLYKGTVALLLREVPSSGVFYLTYEWTQRRLATSTDRDPGDRPPLLRTIVAGGLAGIALWLVAMPPDVIKSRYQTAPPGTYSNLWEVLRRLLRDEGPTALYRGIVPVMILAFPANAACFAGFELARGFLDWLLPGQGAARLVPT